jgi:rfaE bifunctional protein nucleotidyltransferase chain/domain
MQEDSVDCSIHSLVVQNVDNVREHIAPLRAQGKTLVTTNGCFDIVHAGHIRYLSDAAAEGDMLIVGINSDESVRRLKGESRPIQPEADRALIIASLRMVFAAFIFKEDDPRAFLEVLKPDVHVKGGNYPQDIIERATVEAYGGKIKIVSLVPDCSTTGLINKLRSDTAHG